jgi:hypothetical protein
VRGALGTLPWVEQGTIQTDVKTRQVRFVVKDPARFNEAEVQKALKSQGFRQASVKSGSP